MQPKQIEVENCVFCGGSDATEEVVFSDTYTAFQFLQAGEHACTRCAGMFKEPKFRRLNWVLKNEQFVELNDPLAFLDCPDMESPFFLYLTRQHRKHGWVLAVQNPVLNIEKFMLIVDEDYSLIKDSVAMRPLPCKWGNESSEKMMLAYRSPYWDKRNVVKCVPPGAEVFGN